jgi:hypothetical protein
MAAAGQAGILEFFITPPLHYSITSLPDIVHRHPLGWHFTRQRALAGEYATEERSDTCPPLLSRRRGRRVKSDPT